jgi:hypothetical protein
MTGVFCICCRPSPAQSFSGPNPFRIVTIFYCLRFETSLLVASYDSQGHGGGIRTCLHTSSAPNITRVALYSRANRTEYSVVLLVSADRTENISRGCYCCVATNYRRDVFTSALRSNKRGEERRDYSFYTSVRVNVFTESLPSNALAIHVTILFTVIKT